jgi:septum formation protein
MDSGLIDMKVILASGSPRRRELLEAAGLEFEVVPSPAEEIHDVGLGMAGLCEENAYLKARAVADESVGAVVIGADTLVFLDGEALGKPKDMQEAAGMLRRLSGRRHEVCTGVCLIVSDGEVKRLHRVTGVIFRDLSEEGILEYLVKTSPLDKAGSYGIQDHGEMIVERIEGSFENVMGLPVDAVMEVLREIGLPKAGE